MSAPSANGTRPIGHLAILVVYALKHDDDLPLLELHLDRVARHTRVPYTLYAVAERVTEAARARVAAAPNVVMCEAATTTMSGSREHAHYLDAMLPVALAGPATHICTLDVDSFPVRDDWLEVIGALTPTESGFAGVLRAENGDVALPHPSCIVAERAFFERHRPSFSPVPADTAESRRFMRTTGQRPDTGIRLAEILWREHLPWGRLLRSNARNPHYLIAGLYADVVFHLGGISRGKLFHHDLAGSRAHRWSRPIDRIPIRRGPVADAKRALVQRLRRRSESELAAANRAAYMDLRRRLLDDPEALFAYLRGTDVATAMGAAASDPSAASPA